MREVDAVSDIDGAAEAFFSRLVNDVRMTVYPSTLDE